MIKKRFSIAIPASVVSDTPHLREKTSKIGLIGRTAAIFRVDEIIIFLDNPKVNQKPEMDLIALLLSYMETPQYLRKRLFKLKPELQYAGILPPLRTLHHPLNRLMKNLAVGEHREGVTLSTVKEGTLVDIGVEKPALIQNKRLQTNKRITVKVTAINEKVIIEEINRDEIAVYWGYKVTTENISLEKLVKNRGFGLTVATSKYGVQFSKAAEELAKKWKNAENILVAFGAPTKGLYEIAKEEGLKLDNLVDFVVNTIPEQGTETIRTEEALIASLAVLDAYIGF